MLDKDVKNNFDKVFDYDRNGKLNTYEQMRQWEFVKKQHNNKGSTKGSSGSLFVGVLIFMLIIIGSMVSAVIALKK